jgi:hypothetical protein
MAFVTVYFCIDAVSLIDWRLQFAHGAYKRRAWKLPN